MPLSIKEGHECSCLLGLRLSHSHGGHIDNAPRCDGGRHHMRRFGRSDQNRADRQRVGHDLGQLKGNIGGIQTRHHQHIGLTAQGLGGQNNIAQGLAHGRIGLHFTIHFEMGCPLPNQSQGFAHLDGRTRFALAKVRMR